MWECPDRHQPSIAGEQARGLLVRGEGPMMIPRSELERPGHQVSAFGSWCLYAWCSNCPKMKIYDPHNPDQRAYVDKSSSWSDFNTARSALLKTTHDGIIDVDTVMKIHGSKLSGRKKLWVRCGVSPVGGEQ